MMENFLLYVNIGKVLTPKWELIEGEHNLEITTSRGLKSWHVHLFNLTHDRGYSVLEHSFRKGRDVNIKIHYPDGKIRIGWGFLAEDIGDTGKINGNGPLSNKMPEEPYKEHLKQIMSTQDYERLTDNPR